jgi:hypothetical protein
VRSNQQQKRSVNQHNIKRGHQFNSASVSVSN